MSRAEAPIAVPEPRLATYWEAASEGRLAVQKCLACETAYFYPRPLCPLCGSSRTEWINASGRGRIYSFSIMRAARRPTAPAIVELDEGPRVVTAIMDCDVHDLHIGDQVEVAFEKGEQGRPALAFTTKAALEARAYSRAALAASAIVPGIANEEAGEGFARAAVVGAGTMGSGIAVALLQAAVPVTLIDSNPDTLVLASQRVRKALQASVERGRLAPEKLDGLMSLLRCEQAVNAVASADLIIEAIYEQMALKKEMFSQIDRYAPDGAILGSNTSTLDIDEIASATSRPSSVIGLHFFSPANIMKLLEVVRGPRTDSVTIGRAMLLGKRLGKTPVLVRSCDGFVGNRLMIARERQAGRLLIEGALPDQIDRILREFGLPMGTFELQDMAGGIELSYRRRQETGEKDWLIDRLFELGRLGQKTGKGYYAYGDADRKPRLDGEAVAVIEEASRHHGVARRTISDREIRERLLFPMVNEAAKIVEEGVVLRPSDIDVVWQQGYGWPAWRGGPVYWADQVGLPYIVSRLHELEMAHGPSFRPAALLQSLAASGRRLLEEAALGAAT